MQDDENLDLNELTYLIVKNPFGELYLVPSRDFDDTLTFLKKVAGPIPRHEAKALLKLLGS